MNIVMCFDGTWNTAKDQTNVSRIHAAICVKSGHCDADQIKYYDEGVGTAPGSKLTGGIFGWGLDKNLREGYAWLIRHYRPEAKIFLFGFSRGAYTARCLAGLIGECGIPDPNADHRSQGFDRRDANQAIEAAIADQIIERYRDSKQYGGSLKCELADVTRPAKIHFIGVWDTVGTRGIPFMELKFAKADAFRDTLLGEHVDHAFHAVAIDEHRKAYHATLWTGEPKSNQRVEQRWFPGAHSNVGGGYDDDLLPDISLEWIAKKAEACGLKIDMSRFSLDGNEHRSPVRDSFSEFMWGAYKIFFRLGIRHYRPIGLTTTERVDESAFKKWQADASYRPRNLASAAPLQAPRRLVVQG